jgi:hypothetical protein
MTEKTENKPSVGIRPWGSTPKKNRSFDDDLPRLPYMKLKKGINNVRILTGIGTYYQARWKGPKSKRAFGDRIRTSFPTYEDCPVKKYLGLEGKERYMVVVIDRSEGDLKLLDVSPLTKEQIETNLEVKNSMRPGQTVTPRDFDISIKFDPNSKTATNFYSVVAHDSSPISEEDLALIEDVGGQDVLDKVLNKQLICPKPETVLKRMKEDLGWDGQEVASASTKSEAKPLEEPEEDDYSFNTPSAVNG